MMWNGNNQKSGFESPSRRFWTTICKLFEFCWWQIAAWIVHKLLLHLCPRQNVQNEELFWILNDFLLKWEEINNFVSLAAQPLLCVELAHDQYQKWCLELHKFVEALCERFTVFWRLQKFEIRKKQENPDLIWLAKFDLWRK